MQKCHTLWERLEMYIIILIDISQSGCVDFKWIPHYSLKGFNHQDLRHKSHNTSLSNFWLKYFFADRPSVHKGWKNQECVIEKIYSEGKN